jgi:hypothetical protein
MTLLKVRVPLLDIDPIVPPPSQLLVTQDPVEASGACAYRFEAVGIESQ